MPTWAWWLIAGGTVFAVSRVAKARGRLPEGEMGIGPGLVEGGRSPIPERLSYLYPRTDTHKHRGIDVMANRGARVYAPKGGTVAAKWPDGTVSGYGNSIVLRHDNPAQQTLYAHLDAFAPGIRKGSKVQRGQLLGFVGSTQLPRPAMQTGPHLHFEVHLAHTLAIREDNPERMDPEVWLAHQGVPITAEVTA